MTWYDSYGNWELLLDGNPAKVALTLQKVFELCGNS